MFERLLIANRGEIACRVIRTARNLGIHTISVYSDADRNALHVQLADEAVHIGGSAPAASYLDAQKVIAAAVATGAEAIHPGYGFLSENADFSQRCADNQIIFIGPPAKAIEVMGSKSAAKQAMESAGVPLLPGYHGHDQDPALLLAAAEKMGFPVLLKAVAGGGGKGMRQVHQASEFAEALATAQRESLSSFGNDDMLVEKFLEQPRHVEVQVFCDQQGNGVYLFERDCSVQRRHQKIIEEAPAPGLSPTLREQMGEAALKAAAAVDYVGAGTVEFLLDTDDSFYFMEMNTRLQVEHPVTEMITGQDLVAWQLAVANGECLPLQQQELVINGHSFEARIYAEEPANEFLPAAGTLQRLQQPSESAQVRVDTGVSEGDEVGTFYDPMIAKLVVWHEDRDTALRTLARALQDYRITGVRTNIDFLHRLATHPAFVSAALSTNFIARHHDELFAEADIDIATVLPMAALYLQQLAQASATHGSPWDSVDHWRMNMPPTQTLTLSVAGIDHELALETHPDDRYTLRFNGAEVNAAAQLDGDDLTTVIDGRTVRATVLADGDAFRLFTDSGSIAFAAVAPDIGEDDAATFSGGFTAPMNGTIVDIPVNAGDQVNAGDTVVIMEAMKMEHAIRAPSAGRVTDIFFAKGDLVTGGTELIGFEADTAEA